MTAPLVSCSAEEPPQSRADAEVYIREYCEERLGKCDACSPVSDARDAACDHDTCVDFEWARHKDVACFQQELEFDRCRLERLECAEYFAMTIDTNPNSPCYAFVERTVACLETSE